MIDDITNYVDEEDQEEIIVFVDQEKAYDRVEWGWVNHVLKGFNIGSKFCGWTQMLFKNAKTCIKTHRFISTFFSLTRSARQRCLVAMVLYILQAEPMACAIKGTDEIKRIQMSESGNVLESKICMIADDTQLFNKNEGSVEEAFKVLVKYEKASGSKINYEKTNGLLIGRL